MAFTSRASLTPERRPNLVGWVLACALFWSFPACADDEFEVLGATASLVESVYVLDARIEYEFSPEALEALRSGVPLTIVLDIEVQRLRSWWMNEGIATLEQRYRLYYHALSDQFLVRNLNSGAQYNFHSLDGALDSMGVIRHLPLLDRKLVAPGERYQVLLRARLDIEELPSPLRPIAYISPAWRLSSPWYACALGP